MPREASVDRQVKAVLKRRKAWSVKYHGDRWGRGGVPDHLACYRGRFLALESKQPGREKELRPLQVVELERIRQAGGVAEVVSSGEQVERILDGMDRCLSAA